MAFLLLTACGPDHLTSTPEELITAIRERGPGCEAAVFLLIPHAVADERACDVLVRALNYGPQEKIFEPAREALLVVGEAALPSLRRGLAEQGGWTARYCAMVLADLADPDSREHELLKERLVYHRAHLGTDGYGIARQIVIALKRIEARR